MEIIVRIYLVLLIIAAVFTLYYAFLGIVGLFARKQKYPMREDKLKFCIFVPCHNEKTVIAATVRNLAKIRYEKKLLDVYFIADNCSDSTAQKAREAIKDLEIPNFHVLERSINDPTKRGKPHAINWGIKYLEAQGKFYDAYDMLMILDADNFVDTDILKHINSQYLSIKENKRPVMIQTYLDSKNKENLIARGYYVAYRFTNGFFQLPRYKLGLVPGIGGTGFATATSFLKEIGGYHCSSLVEDLEFQTIATLKGKRIAYNHNVRIYDEKPTGIKQSAVQKTRWAQGHWYVFFKYGWRMFLHMINPKEFKHCLKRFDNLIYLSSMLFMTVSWFTMVFSIVFFFLGIRPITTYLPSIMLSVFSILLFPISSLLDGTKTEKKRVVIDFIPNIIASLIHTVIYFYADIVGLLHCRNQKVWKKTAHKVTTMEREQEHKVEKKSNTASLLREVAVTETKEEKVG